MEQFGQFITNHWVLWLALILILLMILVSELISAKQKANAISPQTAVDMMNNGDAVVIDIRSKELFKKGHIIDSVNAQLDDIKQAKLNKYKDKTLIVACEREQQSPAAAMELKKQGFTTAVLAGGINAWQSADLPLVKK
ncbi:MAG: rhodanese-like domain-containing protein [Legionella sp.]|nr:MAG: rhodanese-like domain-containing protein [Legionella sp.]